MARAKNRRPVGADPATGQINWYRDPGARGREAAGIRELRRQSDQLRRGGATRGRLGRGRSPERGRFARRRLGLAAVVATAVLTVGLATSSRRTPFAPPDHAALAGLSLRDRIVTVASSQVGHSTTPARSYCNKYSASWGVGATACPAGTRSEEWCADFAAWVWRHAGVRFSYGFGDGDLNAGAASFYEWALATGRWHPATSSFRPQPGDVAVYGLSLPATGATAAHVGIVMGEAGDERGPKVINGDGDHSGHSVVEVADGELRADAGRGGGAPLIGYASPE